MSEESEAHQDLTIKALRARIAELEKQLKDAHDLNKGLEADLTRIYLETQGGG